MATEALSPTPGGARPTPAMFTDVSIPMESKESEMTDLRDQLEVARDRITQLEELLQRQQSSGSQLDKEPKRHHKSEDQNTVQAFGSLQQRHLSLLSAYRLGNPQILDTNELTNLRFGESFESDVGLFPANERRLLKWSSASCFCFIADCTYWSSLH